MLDLILENVSNNIQFIEEHSFLYKSGEISTKYSCSITNIGSTFYLFWYVYNSEVHVKYIKKFKPNFLTKYKFCFNLFIKFHKRKLIAELNSIDSIAKHIEELKWN